jgi:uncharacterized protein
MNSPALVATLTSLLPPALRPGNPFSKIIKPAVLNLWITIALTATCWLLPVNQQSAQATGIYEISGAPSAQTWIIDNAEILSRLSEGQTTSKLQQLAQKTGTEIRFVDFRRLDYGTTIDQFVDQLFEHWYPEAEDQQGQVLIALDVVSNTAAMHVGPQSSDYLTPDIAQSITGETMAVPMAKEKYNQAISDATTRIVTVLSGQPDPGPPIVQDNTKVEGTFASAEETKGSNATLIVIVLLILATVIPMVTYFAYVR